MRAKGLRLIVMGVMLVGLLAVPAAQATYPGANGKLAWDQTPDAVWTTNADGSGATRFVSGTAPVWSRDGTKLAYQSGSSIHVINEDGSNDHAIATTLSTPLGWSPDDASVAFGGANCTLRAASVDGSGDLLLRQLERCPVLDAEWGPDGSLAYVAGDLGSGSSETDLYVAAPADPPASPILRDSDLGRRDITRAVWAPGGQWLLVDATVAYRVSADGRTVIELAPLDEPIWSPDGSLIRTRSNLRDDALNGIIYAAPGGAHPDWQPQPPLPASPGYPRPKGGSPLYAPLVLSYKPCTAPNRTHAPPLAFGSCSAPQLTSQHLTAGTPDANGQAAGFIGSLKMKPLAGNAATPADEADVEIAVHATDVRCSQAEGPCTGGALSDYTGLLAAFLSGQITDRANGGTSAEPATGTVRNFRLPGRFTVPCTATADTTIGSSCDVVTTIDTLAPNSIQESKRTVWELADIRIADGGPEGDPINFDGTPFLTQGLFTP